EAAARRYAHALWWIRFLLDGPEPSRASRFRAFLAALAGGGESDRAALERALGERLDELEPRFRAFLAERRSVEIGARLAALARPGERLVARRAPPAAGAAGGAGDEPPPRR
ncbi:MAG TPA: hypothetical protein VI942_00960, partial [Thermoanaerobaculia bacterium]|nr:hypothetical protein [Thermoanaerobaculia bacterium]